jgi:spore coat polysaccharide biosynthesis protein SpsF
MTNNFKTTQEKFWAGQFGDEYITRNNDIHLISGNIALFANILAKTNGIRSIIEFGANIGNNLDAIKCLLPDCEFSAVEINEKAADILKNKNVRVFTDSIINFTPPPIYGIWFLSKAF